MKRILTICFVLLAVVFLMGCGVKKSDDLEKAEEDLWVAEMELYGDLCEEEVTNSLFDLEGDCLNYVDFSNLIEKMEVYSPLFEYSNLKDWMLIENVDMNGSEDYTSVFFSLDEETQSRVLRNMFKDTGLVVSKTIATKYEYVPTGNKAEDGTDLVEYKATEWKDVSTRSYAIFPLKLEAK